MALTERYVNSAGSGDGSGSSEANAMSYANFTDYMVTGGTFTAAAGDRFNLKLDGTYARTTAVDTWVNGGTATSPVIVRGYNTTPGDGYLGRTNGNGPLITTNMPVITYTTTGQLVVSGNYIIVESLDVRAAINGRSINNTGAQNSIIRCAVINSGTGASAVAIGTSANSITFDCDANLTGASGGNSAINMSSGVLESCRVKTVTAASGVIASSTATIQENSVFGGGGVGISLTGTASRAVIRNNTIAGNSGDGIDIITGTTVSHFIAGNMITDNGGYGIDLNNAAAAPFLAYNRYRDNTSGPVNLGTDWTSATDYNKVTTDTGGEETDYQDAPSDDYRLISASPAKAAGIPKYASIGALQREEPSGGGGGPVISGPPLIL